MRGRPVALARRVCAVAAAATGVALLVDLGAQQQRPVFRNRTDLVRVDVVVTDGDDRPITDLTADDFIVTQGGRRQTITDFEFVSIPNANRTLDVEGVVPPPPDVATNKPPEDNSRAFVMVVDDRHLLTHDIIPTKRVMTDFLTALGPNDEVALVFVGRSDLSTDFTKDIGRLIETIEATEEVFGFGLGAWNPPSTYLIRQGIRSVGGLHPDELNALRETTLVLENVVRSLVGSRHVRRALVFVSAGFNFDPLAGRGAGDDERARATEMMLELEEIYGLAARANVPMYTLDPRGIPSPYLAVTDPMALGEATGSMSPEDKVQEVLRRIRIQNDRLAEIAINTGGRAFIKQSNLTAAVEQIVADNGSFYLLGYYPEPYVDDGEYHEIDVDVTRPGVRVRARQGYVAPTPAGEIIDAGVSFAETLGQGLPASGLQLRALATPLGPGTDGRVTTGITVRVTYDPQFSTTGVPDEQLRFAVLALDPDARIRMTDERTFSFSLPARPAGPARPELVEGEPVEGLAMEINHVVDLPRGPSAMRLGVASRATGRTGTVHLPIDLPEFADDRLTLGGIVVGHAAAMQQPRATSDAFQAQVPFPPAIARAFDASDAVAVFVRVFPPATASGELQTALTVARDGEVVQAASVNCQPSTALAGALDCLADLSLDLPAGDYALTFAARVTGAEPVSRAIPFSIR